MVLPGVILGAHIDVTNALRERTFFWTSSASSKCVILLPKDDRLAVFERAVKWSICGIPRWLFESRLLDKKSTLFSNIDMRPKTTDSRELHGRHEKFNLAFKDTEFAEFSLIFVPVMMSDRGIVFVFDMAV